METGWTGEYRGEFVVFSAAELAGLPWARWWDCRRPSPFGDRCELRRHHRSLHAVERAFESYGWGDAVADLTRAEVRP